MIKFDEFLNNSDYDIAGEKFLTPEQYESFFNYTISKAFAISNEQLANVFEGVNFEDKSFLTVGSSGDQLINAILCGCKNITVADANIFSQYYIEYKLAFIKNLDYETFKKCFIIPSFFDWKIYSKISHDINPKVRQFWDNFMLYIDENPYDNVFSGKIIKEKMLIVDHSDRHSKFYSDEETYKKLQSLLNNNSLNINYLCVELENFSQINQRFDCIYLSNIYDYYQDRTKFNQIIETLYKKSLKENGSIMAHYSFNDSLVNMPKRLGKFKLYGKEVTRKMHGEELTDTIWIIKKQKQKTTEAERLF